MAKKVRYAVIGAGWISQEAFMPAVHQTGNSEITAIITGNQERARALADFHQVPHVGGYDDYDRMLTEDLFDAVYIALPNSMHADYSIRASNAGKHAMVEKPLAVSEQECEAMIDAAEMADRWLMTAYRLHCEPATVEVLERIRAGEIGEAKFVMASYSFQTFEGNHRLSAEHWGGPLQDIGVYCLNAMRHIFEAEPEMVWATKGHGQGDPRFTEVEGTISAMLRFPGERMAQFTASFEGGDTDWYRVVGTKGTIDVDRGFGFPDTPRPVVEVDGKREKIEVENVDHFGAQIAYFSDCILNNAKPEPDGEEGLADVRALLAIEAAAYTGQGVNVNSPKRPTHPGRDTVRIVPRTVKRLVFER